MFDICVIGCGRVGLPLALALKESGFSVVGCDTNLRTSVLINSNKMPFEEKGCDDLLIKIGLETHLHIQEAKTYIITVGTPLMQHIETDLTYIKDVVDILIKEDKIAGRTIILRSTVAPGTTDKISKYITQQSGFSADKYSLAMCPERLVEGDALYELHTLPQIIGASDLKSFKDAESIFEKLGVKCLWVNYIEAELSKLLCNIYRYINFAIPNYFTYLTDYFGADVYKIFDAMNYEYPRNAGLKSPGFAAGTCLRKDFGMISENMPHSDLLVQAYKINEFMPKFYVDLVEDKIYDKNIGILGYTMKADTDDTRDSLVPKMIRYIERLSPKDILIAEPNFGCIDGDYDDKENDRIFNVYPWQDIASYCDVIFIAMNHKEFKTLGIKNFRKGQIIVDIWNVLKLNKIVIEIKDSLSNIIDLPMEI